MARKRKKPVLEIEITQYAAEGKSFGLGNEGKVIFVPGTVPGDRAEVRVVRQRKNWAEGKLIRLIEASPRRITPFCPHFGVCGGCKWQMIPYEDQLEFKRQQVVDQLRRIGHLDGQALQISITPSDKTVEYRNKLEFTFSQRRYLSREEIDAHQGAPIPAEPALGFHAPGLFDKVVSIEQCFLQGDPTNQLLQVVRSYTQSKGLPYYDYQTQKGWLRNMILRRTKIGEVMINLVFKVDWPEERKALLDHILKEIKPLHSLHYTINPKVNDSIHDLEVFNYWGKGYIEEELDEYRFKISPKSFFQTNSYQAEKLYRKAREMAKLDGSQIVYDLYCGTGSIGVFCASQAQKVVGVEWVEEAVKDARENAERNGIHNARFFSGDVIQVVNDSFLEAEGRPSVIITDPPRAGMHADMVKKILEIGADRLVYISCNPATQGRDLDLLSEDYEVKEVHAFDMFPHTHHIESIALLERKTPRL